MDNHNPLISVIIPCYNVSRYLSRCLESLVSQTIGLSNLEIITVDDASTDDTLMILKEWENRYPDQLIVITCEENQRQGGARNIGLQYASAEYVGFVDSDDWVEPCMYEELYNCICDGSYDAVKCKAVRDSGTNTTPGYDEASRKYLRLDSEIINGLSYTSFPEGVNGIEGGIWAGLYRRASLSEHMIDFPVGLTYEDLYWRGLVRLYVSKVCLIDRVYYHYFVNPESTIMSRNSGHQLDRLVTLAMLMEEYAKRGALDAFYERILRDFIRLFYLNSMFMFFTRFDEIPDIYENMRDTILAYFPDWEDYYDLETDVNKKRKLLLRFLADKQTASVAELENLKIDYLTKNY